MNAPIPLERQLEVVAMVPPRLGWRVIDVGCGTAELLGALVTMGAQGTGYDIDADALDAARQRGPSMALHCVDAAESTLPRADLICCVGSTHAYGRGPEALTGALGAFRHALEPGGHLLVGEGFQRQPLPAGYAEVLGSPHGLERTHLENVRTIEAAGLRCLHAVVASDAEWDAFEWAHYRRELARIADLSERQRGEARARADRWRDAYLRWGCHTMGFGLYLARRPAVAASTSGSSRG